MRVKPTREEKRATSLARGRIPGVQYWTAKTVAKRFNVPLNMLERLVANKKIGGYIDVSPSGSPITLIDIEDFRQRVRGPREAK